MSRRVSALVIAVASLLAFTSGGALATGTLDQHQTSTSGYTILWIPGVQLAQTFNAGVSGKLDSIDLNGTGNGHPITIEIERVASGHPNGTVLDKQSLSLSDGTWNHIALKSAVSVAKGGKYAIVISQFTDVGWNGACSNAYSGGGALVLDTGTWYTVPGWATHSGAPLVSYCALDYAFRTYVTKAAVATPTPSATAAITATPAPTAAAASSTPAPSSAASQIVLGATSGASAGNGQASGAAGPAGSNDLPLPAIAGGAAALLLLIGLLGFLMGRRGRRPTAGVSGPGASGPGANGPGAGTPGSDTPSAT